MLIDLERSPTMGDPKHVYRNPHYVPKRLGTTIGDICLRVRQGGKAMKLFVCQHLVENV